MIRRFIYTHFIQIVILIRYIFASFQHSNALKTDGTLFTWGYNTYGQLGTGDVYPRVTPVSITKHFCQVSGGYSHSLGIDNSGVAWSWGYNPYGQLGDSTLVNKCVPTAVYPFQFNQISAGMSQSVGLDKSGKIWGWGYNNYGQLGDNSVVSKSVPVLIGGTNKTFCQISSGRLHSIGLDKNGKIWGWGYNYFGQLGGNIVVCKSTPIAVLGVNKTFCQISSGHYHTLSIDDNGKVWGWGNNGSGELGINSIFCYSTPVAVLGINKTFCQIAAGQQSSFGLDKYGKVWGWGFNVNGQLGINSIICKSTPVAVLGVNKTFCKITTGYRYSLSIDKYGKVWGWGQNDSGQLGINSLIFKSTPTAILGDNKTFCQISVWQYHSLAIDNYNRIWGWGQTDYLGVNILLPAYVPNPIAGVNKTFCQISSGQYFTIGIDKNGKVWGWGYNVNGQLGINSQVCKSSPTAIIGVVKTFCQISAGNRHLLGVDKYGKIWSWGYNPYGQLGINSNICKSTPTAILGVTKTFCNISAGTNNSMVIDKYGKVWGWGYNYKGQLGINSTVCKSTPTAILGVNKTFCKISASVYWHTTAIDFRGKVWGWGYNNYGQLGINSVVSKSTPTAILGVTKTFCQISNGFRTSVGLDKNGKAWGWGNNNKGQIGDNTITQRNTPVSILGVSKTFCKITTGQYHTIGLDKNGKIWGWGYNDKGQLGVNSVVSTSTPTAILGANKTFCQVTAGFNHTIAVDFRGKVWGWGYNNFGQITYLTYLTPVLISLSPTSFISAGQQHSLGLKKNGQIWSWGYNTVGQLGNNSVLPAATPLFIFGGPSKTFCKITGGFSHSISLDYLGKTWGWGYNNYGQLGINSTVCKSTPVVILGVNKTFCQISAGQYHNFSIDFRGKSWIWGRNDQGQLGINSIECKSTPTAVLGANKTFCQISSGYLHTMAVDKYGFPWSWGYNNNGQLGNNTIVSFSTPIAIFGIDKTFCQISSGQQNTFGLDKYGKVWGWGLNLIGQLGINTLVCKSTPIAILGVNKTFCQISSGLKHTITLDFRGKIWGWGYNGKGQLGINLGANCQSTPVVILGVNKTFCKISAGDSQTFGIDKNGKLWGWGNNTQGVLGDYTTVSKSTPVAVLGVLKTFCKISAGYAHTIVIDKYGKVWCWGFGGAGEVGSPGNYSTPKAILGITKTFCQISAGYFSSMGIDKNGKVWGWGYNNKGQLGVNSTTNKATPTAILGVNKTFCKIAAAQNYTLAIDNYNRVWGWGYNASGQLGDGTTVQKLTPVMISLSPTNFISGGLNWQIPSLVHSTGLKTNGQIYTWGDNQYGEIGNNNTAAVCVPTLVEKSTKNKTFCKISAGNNHTISIDLRGKVWTWGLNTTGQLGNNSLLAKSTPVVIGGVNKTFCDVSAGYTHSLGMDKYGVSWGWGDLALIGNNTINGMPIIPVRVFGDKTFCQISAGQYHSTGIDYLGRTWTWGWNAQGQIGDNTIVARSIPVAVLGNKTFCQISAGYQHTLSIDKYGYLWGWGYNNSGQLGDNTGVSKSIPVAVFTYQFNQISAGLYHSVGLDKYGKVWGWGYNITGQLGDNTVVCKSIPVLVGGVNKTFCQISTEFKFTSAIDKYGKVWTWGENVYGQLGNNTVVCYSTPVTILGVTKTFCKISLGYGHSVGIDKYGKVWGWGYNLLGQLGNNSVVCYSTPISITQKTFCKIAAGYRITMTIDKYGKVWSWGAGGNGQLGINSVLCKSTPVAVLGVNKTFCQITTGYQQSALAIDKYGHVWGWGVNTYGTLGINSLIFKSTPTAILGVDKTFCQISTYQYHTLAVDNYSRTWGWGQLDLLINRLTVTPIGAIANKTFCQIGTGQYFSYGIDYSGRTWSWGTNNYGQLGINSVICKSTPTVIGNKTFCQIAGGNSHSVGIDGHGQVWSWGYNLYGQIGDTSLICRSVPVAVYPVQFCQILAIKDITSFGLDRYGKVWGWGYNNSGQLGINSTVSYSTPVAILGTVKTFCSITGGKQFVNGIDNNGKIWGWGYNADGELGIYSIIYKSTPTAVLGVNKTFCQIASGNKHGLGIDFRGKVWSWGYNYAGQLGTNTGGNGTNKSTPTAILGVNKTFCKISGGYLHTLGLDFRGKMWGWGYNFYGQLGINSIIYYSTPVAILGVNKTFCKISAGFYHTNSIDKYGKVWTWGYNLYGQLGINSIVCYSTPVAILGVNKTFCEISTYQYHTMAIDNYSRVWGWGQSNLLGNSMLPVIPVPVAGVNKTFCQIAGYDHSLSIDKYGKVWGWGNNYRGQLGIYSVICKSTPTAILGVNKTFCSISTGSNHSTGLNNNGQVWGWGINDVGQLGDNSTVYKCTPVAVLGVNKTFCKISLGYSHTTSIDKNGKVWSWGQNSSGQFGDNTIIARSTPIAIGGVNKTFCQINAGFYYHIMGIDFRGKMWAWGYNANGQLGINSVILKSTPTAILGVNKTFCKISSGYLHTLGLDFRGKVWGWGYNNNGQLGIYSIVCKSTPTAILGVNKTFCQISAGQNYSLGIDKNGKIWSWGTNNKGQLGDGTFINKCTPIAIGGVNKTFCLISGGNLYSIAIDLRGKVWAWGDVTYGKTGTYSLSLTPILISLSPTIFISVGIQHSLGLKSDGKIWGWGYNGSGQLGNNITPAATPRFIVGGAKTFCKITGGQHHSIGVDYLGKVWGWGYNNFGQLGNNTIVNKCTPTAILGIVKTFCQINSMYSQSFGIDKNGKLWGWGYNNYGQLGDKTIISKITPVDIIGFKRTFCQITAGYYHTITGDKYGKIWSWGNNNYGGLGINSLVSKSTPTAILGVNKTFCQISAGSYYTMGIDLRGKVWGWGQNNRGQLGNFSLTQKMTPTDILGVKKTFCKITTGQYHTIGVEYNGHLWGWGYNMFGQLGVNSNSSYSTPVAILGVLKTFCQIASGDYHTSSIDKNGKVWGWGYNFYGQLGINSQVCKNTPVAVVGVVKTFCQISAGLRHTIGIDKNGKVWGWGQNVNGQLGINSVVSKSTPTAILGVSKTFCKIYTNQYHTMAIDNYNRIWGWGRLDYLGVNLSGNILTPILISLSPTNFISAGNQHSMGLKSDGLLFTWGDNTYGQIGNNTIVNACFPTIYPTQKTFCTIASAQYHTLGIDKNGKIWTWGLNAKGQLGDNTIISKNSPVNLLGVNKTFCQIVGGANHSAGLDRYGKIWNWGDNTYGQLGTNNYTSKSTPVALLGVNKTFCQIEAGLNYTIGLDIYGKSWGWGDNTTGQLGIYALSLTPILINLSPTSVISAGNQHSMGLKTSGQVWSWGQNTYGQIGNNTVTQVVTPLFIIGGIQKTFCKISGGQWFSLGIDDNGKTWSWGYNSKGQLGDRSILNRSTPVAVGGIIKTFCEISSGFYHSMGIDKNGKTWGWGYNNMGQLGVNSIVSYSTPMAIDNIKKTFCQISAGLNQSFGLDKNGKIWGWGYNQRGLLGINSVICKSTPTAITGVNKTFCEISTGQLHSNGLDKYGRVWGWGYNSFGQVGDNTIISKSTPVVILGTNKTFCQISSGNLHSLGIDQYGKIWIWGYNSYGQLGINSTVSFNTPVTILGVNKTFCQISGGQSQFTFGLDKYGKVWGWGYNATGNLGINSIINKSTPTAILGVNKTFCQISSGKYNVMGIDKNGKGWGWGRNYTGQLGINSIINTSTPTAILGVNKTFCQISTYQYHSLAIDNYSRVWGWGQMDYLGINRQTVSPMSVQGVNKTFCQITIGQYHSIGLENGNIWGWGYDNFGQLGNNSTINISTPTAILGVKKTFCQISSGGSHSIGLDKNGKIWSWGYNLRGQLGNLSTITVKTPVGLIGVNKTFCQISGGNNFSFSIDKYGKIWTWGDNLNGQLGINSVVCKSTPIAILGTNKTFCKIFSGNQNNHIFGIDLRGKVWGWGYNNYGQVGINVVTHTSTPVAILGVNKTFCSIGNGTVFTVGLDKNGKIWSWGNNTSGQLGINSTTSYSTPVAILGVNKTFCQISVNGSSSFGLDKYGKIWSWGYNFYGQLGDNTMTNRSTPTAIFGVNKTFCKITSGGYHTIAVDKYSKSWSWGYNNNGQLGFSSFILTPVLISLSPTNFISTGNQQSLGLKVNGELYSWGNNNFGQLGTNNSINKGLPFLVEKTQKTFCKISTGYYHTVGIDDNGKVWSWGHNLYGQLGDNTIVSKNTPINLLGTNKTFCQITTGQYHTVGIDDNGKVWSWGINTYGQLGICINIPTSTPVALMGVNKTFCKITAGYQHTIGIDKYGKSWAWGYNNNGQLGMEFYSLTPIRIYM